MQHCAVIDKRQGNKEAQEAVLPSTALASIQPVAMSHFGNNLKKKKKEKKMEKNHTQYLCPIFQTKKEQL